MTKGLLTEIKQRILIEFYRKNDMGLDYYGGRSPSFLFTGGIFETNGLTQADVARVTTITYATITYSIKELERRGYLTRNTKGRDYYIITDEGIKLTKIIIKQRSLWKTTDGENVIQR